MFLTVVWVSSFHNVPGYDALDVHDCPQILEDGTIWSSREWAMHPPMKRSNIQEVGIVVTPRQEQEQCGPGDPTLQGD